MTIDFRQRMSKKQPERKLPEGWTETKISENVYLTQIPQEQKDKWNTDRRTKDKVDQLVNKDGFHIKNHGRAGTIYYVENGNYCEIHFEISGVHKFDILIFFDSLKEWVIPDKQLMTETDKEGIKNKLKAWLISKNIKADV